MLRLSPAAELAVRGVLVLGKGHGNGPVSLEKICAERDLPKPYLAKIFSSLAKADLVTPVRGKRGGYRLSRPPEDISVLEVIEAVEGPIALNLCQHDPPKCDEVDCRIGEVWSHLQATIRHELGSMTIRRALQNGNGHVF